MTKGVDIISGFRCNSELLLEITLRDKRMSREALSGRDIAVGLKEPAADYIPASLPDSPLYLREHLRVNLLDPLIVDRAGAREPEVRVIVHSVKRAPEGRADLGEALLPAPEPDGVDMRVSYKIGLFHFPYIPFLKSRRITPVVYPILP